MKLRFNRNSQVWSPLKNSYLNKWLKMHSQISHLLLSKQSKPQSKQPQRQFLMQPPPLLQTSKLFPSRTWKSSPKTTVLISLLRVSNSYNNSWSNNLIHNLLEQGRRLLYPILCRKPKINHNQNPPKLWNSQHLKATYNHRYLYHNSRYRLRIMYK